LIYMLGQDVFFVEENSLLSLLYHTLLDFLLNLH